MCIPLIHKTDAASVLHRHGCWCQCGVGFSNSFWDTPNTTWNRTWVCGCPTRQKI
uniref:Uncharacterized protein n=1 Tax=Arundo donax TaxID=35708 RepID=A0A0A9HJE3_ARUDO